VAGVGIGGGVPDFRAAADCRSFAPGAGAAAAGKDKVNGDNNPTNRKNVVTMLTNRAPEFARRDRAE
jgi:hypothetical protein